MTPEPVIGGTYRRKRDGKEIQVMSCERAGAAYRWVAYRLDRRTYRVSIIGFWKKFEREA